jgi:peptidoglycan-N-acetylglucosamine deacetylase
MAKSGPLGLRRPRLRSVGNLLSAPLRGLLGTMTHVTTRDPVAALTFDDGPHPEYTPRLLEILEGHRARATFFMVGKNAERHPELVEQVSRAGHTIGNHSWDHPSFPLISGRERRAQIRSCARALGPRAERLFRPPYGMQTMASRLDAALLGYRVVAWNVTADDWRSGDAGSMADQLERQIRPGSVVLLHDRLVDVLDRSYFDRRPVLQAVQILLDRLRGRFEFVTIPELLSHGRPHKEFWIKAANVEWLNRLQRLEEPARTYLKRRASTSY